MHRERSVQINASPEVVYDYVSDILKHPEWAAQKMEMRHTGGPEKGVGAEFASMVHFMGNVPGKLRVVSDERPRRFTFEARDSSGAYLWTFTLETKDGGTKLTHSFDRQSAPVYIKLIQPWLMYPLLGKGMFDKGLAHIKARCEAPVPAA